MTDDAPHDRVGYRLPPRTGQFQKGRSGNPHGRPKGKANKTLYDRVLGQMVTISENGVEKQVTAAEAFLLKRAQDGLKGDPKALKQSLAAIGQGKLDRQHSVNPIQRCVVFVSPGNPNSAMISLRMARKLDPYRSTARIVLEPWLVQVAVDRLGEKRLSPQGQTKVVNVTRTPHKVRWPGWWTSIG